MKISQNVAECAAVIERETGRKMTDKAMRIAESVYQIGLKLHALGHRHAQEGCKPASESEIQRLTAGIANPDLRAEITSMMYEAYMDGYEAREVQHV